MTDILLPQLGETMEEAEIIAWLKAVGDHVERGEPLLEVETDKIAVEVPALESGVLAEILVQAGASAVVGAPIARLRADVAGNAADPAVDAPPAAAERREVGVADTTAVGSSHTEPQPPRASPAARTLARQLGVDLAAVTATGPGGRITPEDVKAAASSVGRGAPVGQPTAPTATDVAGDPATNPRTRQAGTHLATHTALHPASPTGTPTATPTAIPPATPTASPTATHALTRIEQATARTTQAAFRDIPHFYVRTRVDVTRLMALLEDLRTAGPRVTVTDLVVLACARTLRRHPRLNASVADDGLLLHADVNIGVITATPEGLVSAVIPRADGLTPGQVHARSSSVRERLGAGSARLDDVSGATFAISNLGMFGIDEFSAIILPPNVAILALGAVREDVLVTNGALRFAKTLHLTLSADHRALGGVEAARFLTDLRDALEAPEALLAAPGVPGAPGAARGETAPDPAGGGEPRQPEGNRASEPGGAADGSRGRDG